MKANNATKKEHSPKGDYKKIMSNIDFMQQYMSDPEIFQSDSPKCRNFLIQSFAHLHSDFHYLSFLNKEDVDQEIVKVAGILQILSKNPNKKTTNLFENMSEVEINKFWLRFFSLFRDKKADDFSVPSLLNINLKNKTDFFTDINSTFNYLNYNFPVINLKNLNSVDINKEVEKWNEDYEKCDTAFDNSSCFNCDVAPVNNADIKQLMMDLKLIITTYNTNQYVTEENKSDYSNFFINFSNLCKSILKYKNDLSVIDSTLLEDLHSKMLSENQSDWSENLYFIKRCNNLIRTLKLKIREIE